MQTKLCLPQVLLLWPLGHVCVWVVHDQKPLSHTHACTWTHTIYFTISACVYFSFLSCLFSLMGAGFLLKLPRSLLFNLCVVLPPPFSSTLRCQWWWWNQPLRQFERHRPIRMESAASAANQMEGEVERAALTETPMEKSAQSTCCTCNSNRCVYVCAYVCEVW